MKIWEPDNFDGTYTNPVVYTDYSDPDVIRVGRDYFCVASSFCNSPGLPVLHSTDLLHWKMISYGVEKLPYERYELPQHGCGVWAPAIRYHEGEFVIFFPMPDEGIFMVKTKDPWGKWSEPVAVFEGKGWIDPCPFFDEDGRVYMVNAFAKSRIGFKSVLQLVELKPDLTGTLGEAKVVFDGNLNDQVTIEGPKMYKRNGYYYIFAPAGGVKQGWQTVLRSKNIEGPYEYKVVCEQKDTPINGPHQGGYVDTESGEYWFLHFQDVYAAGRIMNLEPMHWVEDWPVIGEAAEGEMCGKPVITWKKPDVSHNQDVLKDIKTKVVEQQQQESDVEDDFDKDTVGLMWQWNANYKEEWYTCCPKQSVIRLHAIQKESTISNQPNLFLQKWPAPEFTIRFQCDVSELTDGDMSGIINMGVDYAALAVKKEKGLFSLIKIIGRQKFEKEIATAVDTYETVVDNLEKSDFMQGKMQNKIYFQYKVNALPSIKCNTEGKYAFWIKREQVVFSYSTDGKNFTPIMELEPSAGRWVGTKFGVFCCSDHKESKGSLLLESVKLV